VATGVHVLTASSTVVAQPFDTTAGSEQIVVPGVVVEGNSERYITGEGLAAEAVAPPVLVPPARALFPGSGVAADVVPVGVLPSGELQLPVDPARVGWWASGALPGQRQGTVVLAGHMDGLHRSGAMRALLDLAPGDMITIEDRHGAVHEYRAVSRYLEPWDSLDTSIFTTEGPHRLVLITCGGRFDEQAGRYDENVVVAAEPVAGQSHRS
jgi:hypothetical protein